MAFITLTGTVGKPAEVKTSKAGKDYVSISIRKNEYNSESRKSENVWYNCMAFGERYVKMIDTFLQKGAVIEVVGEFSPSVYQGKLSRSIMVNGLNFIAYAQERQNDSSDDSSF